MGDMADWINDDTPEDDGPERKPDPLPTEEELARQVWDVVHQKCKALNIRLEAAQRYGDDPMDRQISEAIAGFILSHLKPGGWRA